MRKISNFLKQKNEQNHNDFLIQKINELESNGDDFLNKEKPVDSNLWLQESKDQLKNLLEFQKEFSQKISWQSRFTLALITAISALMTMTTGFPKWEMPGSLLNILWYLYIILLAMSSGIIYWKLLRGENYELLIPYYELKTWDNEELHDPHFGTMRLIQALGVIIKTNNETLKQKLEWYNRSFLVILGIVVAYIFTLFL